MSKLYTMKCPDCGLVVDNVTEFYVCKKCNHPRPINVTKEAIKTIVKNSLDPLFKLLQDAYGERGEECRIRTDGYEINYFSSGDCFIKERN